MSAQPPTNQVFYGYGIPSAVLPLKAAACVFDICQHQSYISIKDQIIRARLLAEWLHSTGVFGGDTTRINSVLVVGGGVAGVCTAALITEYGVKVNSTFKVTLVDKESDLFTAQEKCDTRSVSLTQYDWPAGHYNSHALPSTAAIFQPYVPPPRTGSFRLTVPNLPTRASDLAKLWRNDFQTWHQKHHDLHRRPKTTATLHNSQPTQAKVTVDFKDENSAVQSSEDFDLVIFATGFNLEKIPPDPATGKGQITPFFWEHDDYADPKVSHANKEIAIIGMGDGALQDFLRLVCDPGLRCTSEIVNTIKREFITRFNTAQPRINWQWREDRSWVETVVVSPKCMAEEAWQGLERQLADIDRQAILSSPWDSDGRRGMRDLHADVMQVLRDFVSSNIPAKILEPAIDAVLRRSPDALHSITLIAPLSWPSKCYMLNRFLFALITWRLANAPAAAKLPSFKPVQAEVDSTYLSYTGGRYKLTLPTVLIPMMFDGVVWRTGVGGKEPTSKVEGLRLAIGKHALPFYPPDRFR